MSAYICYTWWGSHSSLARAKMLWMLTTRGTLETFDVVADYSWGVTTLAHLYRELNNAACWNCGQVAGYLTLLQV